MMAQLTPRRLSKSEEAHVSVTFDKSPRISRDPQDVPPVYDRAELYPEFIGDALRQQAFCNIGIAATVHKEVQTDDGGMRRIIYNVGFFNKLLRTNQCLEELVRKAPEESRKLLHDKVRVKWEQLQEVVRKKMEDMQSEETHRIRVMQLLRRQRLEVAMRQLKIHYMKEQQKRVDDMEMFKETLKTKFILEMEQKTNAIDDLRVTIRQLHFEVEEKSRADRRLRETSNVPEAERLDGLIALMEEKVTDLLNETQVINAKVTVIQSEIEDEEAMLFRLTLTKDEIEERLKREDVSYEEQMSRLRQRITETKAAQEQMKILRDNAWAELAEKNKTKPVSVFLEQDLEHVASQCEQAVETVKNLRQDAEAKAQQWNKKLRDLENAVMEIRKEMFQATYSLKMSQQQALYKAKNPMILKGLITQGEVKDAEKNPHRMVFQRSIPGKVLRRSTIKPVREKPKTNFVSRAESIEEVIKQAQAAQEGVDIDEGQDLAVLFSKESDIDKLVSEVESFVERIDDEVDPDESPEAIHHHKDHRNTIVNPMVPRELSLYDVMDNREDDEDRLMKHRSSGFFKVDSFILRMKKRGYLRKEPKKYLRRKTNK